MTVKEVLRLAKIRLANIVISKNDEAMLDFINLGVNELYRRFDLKVKSETVEINDNLALYELRSPDVIMLLTIFNRAGVELKQTDVIDSRQYDYKQINYRTFMLKKPFNGELYALYKASSVPLADKDDIIDLPDAMIDALLAYISYAGYYTINRDNMNEANTYFQRFEMACASLEMQGYKMPLSNERISLAAKGFI